ncbi:tetratricopeptide repeat-containing hybrid sensor histidine kinase/response regulator [Parvularcula maris]|uniref:histidine kinase n=1 Tax=Parvularcula maris TaxID=2965077 RepID=A0A9X2RJL7_9PROT|nr:ATP-binding protein [Parvularcula maris]MCQ8185986.1 ATP-binding protein [Parvularcula maris]
MSQKRTLAALLALMSAAALQPAAGNQAGTGPVSLLERAQAAVPSDTETGLALAREAAALEMAGPTPRSAVLQRAAWLEAEALFRLGRLEEAGTHLDNVFATIEAENTPVYGKLLIADGRIARSLGQDGRALKDFQEAFTVFAELGDRRYMAISLQAIGTLYQNARQYDRAIEYIERSRAIGADDPMLTVAGLNNAANAHRFAGRLDIARRLLREALEMEAVRALPFWQLTIQSNLALVEWQAGEMAAAADALSGVKALIAENPSLSLPPNAGAIEARLLATAGKPQEALASLANNFPAESLKTATEASREAHQMVYALYRELGVTDRALAHLETYKRLVDAERDIAASANLAILNAEFELSAKELEISNERSQRLEAEVAASEAKRRQQLALGTAACFAALALVLFLVTRIRQSIRLQRITKAHNAKLEDVNDQLRESNAALEQANAAKTEFLATTSHEVRTPLNAVINLTANVVQGLPKGTDAHLKLSTALRSAEHLHAIVSDVLDVARFEGKRVEARISEVDVVRTATDVANLWSPKAKEKKIGFEVAFSPSAKLFPTDDKLLRQILSNLLSNAVKFTEEGSVKLSLSGGGEDDLTLTVSDTGIGIAPADQACIFESFRQIDAGSTRSFGGTGLGLAICRQITDLLGGDITVKSAVGRGTSITVTIPPSDAPVSALEEEEQESAEEPSEETLRPLRILAAEDNAVNAMVIQAILKNKVSGLTIVENGAEAVTAVTNGGFDVVLMDKQMPVMDGVEAIRRIRALEGPERAIPIIAVTADAFAEAREELMGAGADDYLSKPVKPEDLKESIAATYKGRGGQAPLAKNAG